MEDPNPHRQWSPEELRGAEVTASAFLAENGSQIAETLRAKAKFLELLIQRVSQPKTSLPDRLDCFARISEIAKLIEDDADGFFDLASRPVFARIVSSVPRRRR